MFRRKKSAPASTRKRRKGDAPIFEHLSTLSGRERVKYAFAHPRSLPCKEVIVEATRRVARRYVAAYKERTGRKYWDHMVNKNERSFRKIAAWCAIHGLRYDEWFRWGAKYHKKNAASKGFPAPTVFAGEWLSNAYIESLDSGGHAHAGHTYAEASTGLRDRIRAGGIDTKGIDNEMLEYLESSAREKKLFPETYQPETDERYASIVDWIVENEVTDGNG